MDELYKKVTERYPEIEVVTADAGYKTPWICKQIFNSGRLPEIYSKKYQCESCSTKEKCTESKNGQKTTAIHIWHNYIEQAEDVRHSAYRQGKLCVKKSDNGESIC